MWEVMLLKAHLNLFDDLMMKMKAVELNMDEEQKTMVVLCSLPEWYTVLTNNLIYGSSTLTLEDVMTRLQSKETRDRMKLISESGEASSSQGQFIERERRRTIISMGILNQESPKVVGGEVYR